MGSEPRREIALLYPRQRVEGGRGRAALIAIDMSPSHAAETNADKTVNWLIETSVRHDCSG